MANGGWTYPSFYLGHTKKYEIMLEDIKWWLQENKHGWYERQLQSDTTCVIGSLLFSLQAMNADIIRNSIMRKVGAHLGIRWRTIAMPRGGKIQKKNLVKALHIECDVKDRRRVRRSVNLIYGSEARVFPLGITMHIIPPIHTLMNLEARQKAESLRLRQKQFCLHMKSVRMWEIDGLDVVDPTSLLTMRERLNSIPSSTSEDIQLFHSVDNSFQEGAVVLSFHPDREDEARAMVTGFIPYLKYKARANAPLVMTPSEELELYSRRVYKFFTQEAIDRADGATWDPIENTVISPQDEEITNLVDVDPHLDMSHLKDVDTDDVTIEGGEQATTRVRPHDPVNDDESTSTFGTVATNAGTAVDSNQGTAASSVATNASSTISKSSSSRSRRNRDLAITELFGTILPGLQTLALNMPESPEAVQLQSSLLAASRLLSPPSEARRVEENP